MNKKILILIVVIIAVAGYVFFQDKIDKNQNVYLNVPELKIRFKNVNGLSLNYLIETDKLIFTSSEIKSAALVDSGISYCVANTFPALTISSFPKSQGEFQGYNQIKLNDGRYLNEYGQQAVCYDPASKPTDIQLINSQSALFTQFLNSVQSY